MAQPLVTVVITCYSHKNYFKRTLDSVLRQTARDKIKIIVHDNGCPMDYRKLIQHEIAGKDVTLISEEKNGYGLPFRINVLPSVDTKYVAMLHDDDIYAPNMIEASLTVLEEKSLDFVVNNIECIDEEDNPHAPDIPEMNIELMFPNEKRVKFLGDIFNSPGLGLHQSAAVLSTHVAKKVLYGDPFYPRIADAFFWAELLLQTRSGGYEILTERLTKVRIHAKNDRLYSKFRRADRNRELFLLSLSEERIFQMILERLPADELLEFANNFMGSRYRRLDLVESLVELSFYFSGSRALISKDRMCVVAFHKAFEIEPVRASGYLQERAKMDANQYMKIQYGLVYARQRNFFRGADPLILRVLSIFTGGGEVSVPRRLFYCFCWAPSILLLRKVLSPKRYSRLRQSWRSLKTN